MMTGSILPGDRLQHDIRVDAVAEIVRVIETVPAEVARAGSSDSLTAPNWTNIGPAKSGNDPAQTFPDPAATGAQGFYRIVVTP